MSAGPEASLQPHSREPVPCMVGPAWEPTSHSPTLTGVSALSWPHVAAGPLQSQLLVPELPSQVLHGVLSPPSAPCSNGTSKPGNRGEPPQGAPTNCVQHSPAASDRSPYPTRPHRPLCFPLGVSSHPLGGGRPGQGPGLCHLCLSRSPGTRRLHTLPPTVLSHLTLSTNQT